MTMNPVVPWQRKSPDSGIMGLMDLSYLPHCLDRESEIIPSPPSHPPTPSHPSHLLPPLPPSPHTHRHTHWNDDLTNKSANATASNVASMPNKPIDFQVNMIMVYTLTHIHPYTHTHTHTDGHTCTHPISYNSQHVHLFLPIRFASTSLKHASLRESL